MKWKLSVSGAKFPWRLYGRKLPCFFLDSEGCQQSLVFLGLLTHHSNLCLSLYHHLPCGSVSLCLYVSILKGHQLLDLGSILIQYACMLSHLVVSLCNPTDHNTALPAPQAPLSMGFSRQEYWNVLPFLLSDSGIEPTFLTSPALAG